MQLNANKVAYPSVIDMVKCSNAKRVADKDKNVIKSDQEDEKHKRTS